MMMVVVAGGSVTSLWNVFLADLDGFSLLTAVKNDLYISGSMALTSLAGLGNITSTGLNFIVSACPGLTSLEGLGG